MAWWHRALIAGGVVLLSALLAKLIDRRIARRDLTPEAATRYRVLRRSVMTAVVTIGLLSALFVIPQVRAVAGALLASSAVLGLVIGFAARTTLANFIAGLLIAFTQPLRLGDVVEVDGDGGTVEEIGLTYTLIRKRDGVRVVIPNEKLATDTIRNSTLVSREKLAEITLQVPLASDLDAVVRALREETAAEPGAEVLVTALEADATVTVRARAADAAAADDLESELRRRAHTRLRAEGILG